MTRNAKKRTDGSFSPSARFSPRRSAAGIVAAARPVFLSLLLILFSGCANRSLSPVPDAHPETPSVYGGVRSAPATSAPRHYLRARWGELNKDFPFAADELRLALAFDPDSAKLHFELARMLVAENRLEAARSEFLIAARLDPDWANPPYFLGEIAFSNHDIDAAKAYFSQVLMLDPSFRRANQRLADIAYLQQGVPGKVRYLTEAVKRDARDLPSWIELANLYHYQQEYGKLETALVRILRLDPDNTSAIEKLAGWYNRTRRYKDAVALFIRLRNLLPPNPVLLVKLGSFYLGAGDLERAAQTFEAARGFDIRDDRTAMSVALAYLESERMDEAERALSALLDGDQGRAARYFLGWIHYHTKRYRSALRVFGGLEGGGDHYELIGRMDAAHCLWLLGRKKTADRHLRETLERFPREMEVYRLAAFYFRETKRGVQSLEILDHGLKILNDNLTLLYLKGMMLEQNGQREEALQTVLSLLRLDPGQADALNFVGYTFAQEGRELEKAERLIRKAMRLKPEESYIIDSLGFVLYKKGELREALSWLSLAAMMEPQEPEILLHYCMALRDSGERESELSALLERAAGLKIEDARVEREFRAAFPERWPELRNRLFSKEKS